MDSTKFNEQVHLLTNIEDHLHLYKADGQLKSGVSIKEGEYQVGFLKRLSLIGTSILSRIKYSGAQRQEQHEQKLIAVVARSFANLVVDCTRNQQEGKGVLFSRSLAEGMPLHSDPLLVHKVLSLAQRCAFSNLTSKEHAKVFLENLSHFATKDYRSVINDILSKIEPLAYDNEESSTPVHQQFAEDMNRTSSLMVGGVQQRGAIYKQEEDKDDIAKRGGELAGLIQDRLQLNSQQMRNLSHLMSQELIASHITEMMLVLSNQNEEVKILSSDEKIHQSYCVDRHGDALHMQYQITMLCKEMKYEEDNIEIYKYMPVQLDIEIPLSELQEGRIEQGTAKVKVDMLSPEAYHRLQQEKESLMRRQA